jgi:succinoglycan biosynthesis protein ExoA
MTIKVSIIVPCYNEARTIGLLLEAIYAQTYPRDELEAIIADGMSTDGTRGAIEAFMGEYPSLAVRVVDNPKRIIPAALNQAIAAAGGEVIVRLDAHSVPRPDYVERCVDVLERTSAANVGGVWDIQPSQDTWLGRAIAAAASHPLGAGGARYRTGGEAGEVDTVPFGAFQRAWLERVGPFDESLLTNEDYEFNVRIRQAGGVVWFDPAIQSTYFARGDLRSLARQYSRYGYWKAKMAARYPGTLRWRQALPPLFVLALIMLGISALFLQPARVLFGVQLGLYGVVTLLTSLWEALRKHDPALMAGFPLALWAMHFSWGGAFLWGLLLLMYGGKIESRRA